MTLPRAFVLGDDFERRRDVVVRHSAPVAARCQRRAQAKFDGMFSRLIGARAASETPSFAFSRTSLPRRSRYEMIHQRIVHRDSKIFFHL